MSAKSAVSRQQIVDVLLVQTAVEHFLEILVANRYRALCGGVFCNMEFFNHVPCVDDVPKFFHFRFLHNAICVICCVVLDCALIIAPIWGAVNHFL